MDVKIEETNQEETNKEETKQEETATTNNIDNDEKSSTLSRNPKTGDNITIWISLMIISIFGIVVFKKKITSEYK